MIKANCDSLGDDENVASMIPYETSEYEEDTEVFMECSDNFIISWAESAEDISANIKCNSDHFSPDPQVDGFSGTVACVGEFLPFLLSIIVRDSNMLISNTTKNMEEWDMQHKLKCWVICRFPISQEKLFTVIYLFIHESSFDGSIFYGDCITTTILLYNYYLITIIYYYYLINNY